MAKSRFGKLRDAFGLGKDLWTLWTLAISGGGVALLMVYINSASLWFRTQPTAVQVSIWIALFLFCTALVGNVGMLLLAL